MDAKTRNKHLLLPSSTASGCHHTASGCVHVHSARQQVMCAVNACDEALAGIMDLPCPPGVTAPEQQPEFLLYRLVMLTGFLTMTVQDYLEDDHANQ
jgi:hypothetical protein